MSDPTVNNLRRQISDTRPKKGSVVAGFPEARVKICDLEGLIARYEALQTSLHAAREIVKAAELMKAAEMQGITFDDVHGGDNKLVGKMLLWLAAREKLYALLEANKPKETPS